MGTPTTNRVAWKPAAGDRGAATFTSFNAGMDRLDLLASQVINVKGFWDGATWQAAAGDGVTDDYAVIQAAIDLCADCVHPALVRFDMNEIGPLGIVYLPPGTYLISQRLVLKPYVQLRGHTQNSTHIVANASFPTSKLASAGGWALIVLSGNPVNGWDYMRPLVSDLTLDFFDAPDDEIVGMAFNFNIRRTILERVVFFGSTNKTGHQALYFPKYNLDADMANTATTANHNSSVFRNLTIRGCKNANGAIYAEVHTDTQWVIFERCMFNTNRINIKWGGINCIFRDLAMEVVPTPHLIAGTGCNPRILFTAGPNTIEGGYWDGATLEKAIHLRAVVYPTIHTPKLYIYNQTPGLSSKEQVLCYNNDAKTGTRTDAKTITFTGEDNRNYFYSTIGPQWYYWIGNGTDLTRYKQASFTLSGSDSILAVDPAGPDLPAGTNLTVIREQPYPCFEAPFTDLPKQEFLPEPCIAGETLGLGQVVYLKSDGKYWKAKADSTATMPATGIVYSTSAAANAAVSIKKIAHEVSVSLTPGTMMYVSAATAGAVTTTAPSSAGQCVQVIGQHVTTDLKRYEFRPIYTVVPA